MYKATIVKLPDARPHPNADRLQLFTIMGYQIITSLDYEEGALGIFFPPDGQVSEEYAKYNDLVGYTDEEGNRAGGFMTAKRRVKAINLRGEKSQGLWMPMESLYFLWDPKKAGDGKMWLNEGDEIDTVEGHQFCNKYFTPATQSAMGKKRTHTRKETPTFKRHVDTAKLQQNIGRIPINKLITITEKVHGTSGRYGRSLEIIERPWYSRWLLGNKEEWMYLSGTRNVIHRTEKDLAGGFYTDNSFRMKAVRPLRGNLHKGEVVYFEIVGWESPDKPIMPPVNPKELRDKRWVEAFGEKMYYKYGVPNGECKMLVYRITMSNEDGVTYDLSWDQVKKRCGELGVEPVFTMIDTAPVESLLGRLGYELPARTETDREEKLRTFLLELSEKLAEGPSTYDMTHMKEGVVLRIETGDPTPMFVKYKSHEFLVLEGHTKNREDYVDLEEIS